ncbi:MAG: glycosyltransferase [Candidatus Methanospirareceae archaeon]
MNVGVFHWAFDFFGGGEKVAMDIADALGKKRVYTLFSEGEDPDGKGIKAVDISEYLPRWARFLGKITKSKRALEYWLWEMIDVTELGDFDVIVTSGVTPRAIIAPEHIMHVNYNHSVPRWLWDLWHYRWKLTKRSLKIFTFAELFRWMDVIADSRVDYYFVNSELIKRRLWKYLKRDSVVLHPSIETKKYRFKEYGDFVLHMGRFDVEKQILPVVKACESFGIKLVITGSSGNDRKTYEYVRKHNGNGVIDFRGFVSEEEKLELLATCKAVIYNPINEDFGLIPTEALASGKPVIVNRTGYPPFLIRNTGVVEENEHYTVCRGGIIANTNGFYVPKLEKAIEALDRYEWSPEEMKGFALRFDFEVFKKKLKNQLEGWKEEFDRMLEG